MIYSSLFFGALAATVTAATVRYNLPIVNRLIQPDGFSRTTVLAGGTFPGTLIKAVKGDQFKINVKNKLTDNTMLRSTSIHWHGFFQKGSNEMDGGVGVNQCPIAPSNSFLYDFSTARQAGTFWYHSHLSTQYCDGLRGPIVVYDLLDPHRLLYDVDNDNTVITLSDWYHTKALVMPIPAIPESTLINGLGRFDATPSPLAVIKVIKGLRYRFRIVSLSCDPFFRFSIHNHKFTVIEADGQNTKPLSGITSLDVFAGQRYSVVMKADQPIGNYWIRAKPNLSTDPEFTNNRHSAILRYLGARKVEPTTLDIPSTKHLLETDLCPLSSPAAPGRPEIGGADVNINLALGFAVVDGVFKFTVNGAAFEPPSVPVLLQILSGAREASELLPAGSVYPLPHNKVIELTIPSAGAPGAPHPFHLHGHSFSVVRSAGSSTYNYANPMRRDVVDTGAPGDNVTIRFVTDNPGPWLLHCHIDWHFEAGLAVVFAEATNQTIRANTVGAAWSDLCPLYAAINPDDRRVGGRPNAKISALGIDA